ncbi:hypothetical protein JKP88DRAFT_249431 [Tribonema minus]|uniref:Uncharacterized protein n=1 Tax=Tribonema minus TaxID=303371 RepID=A0A835YL36_9STRA|nr:hypothetical protein JKP88DRAFT_249431 [Tribonema minus]
MTNKTLTTPTITTPTITGTTTAGAVQAQGVWANRSNATATGVLLAGTFTTFAIYAASASGGVNSIAGAAAGTIGTVTGAATRIRCGNASTAGLIIENSSELALLSVNSQSGKLVIRGPINGVRVHKIRPHYHPSPPQRPTSHENEAGCYQSSTQSGAAPEALDATRPEQANGEREQPCFDARVRLHGVQHAVFAERLRRRGDAVPVCEISLGPDGVLLNGFDVLTWINGAQISIDGLIAATTAQGAVNLVQAAMAAAAAAETGLASLLPRFAGYVPVGDFATGAALSTVCNAETMSMTMADVVTLEAGGSFVSSTGSLIERAVSWMRIAGNVTVSGVSEFGSEVVPLLARGMRDIDTSTLNPVLATFGPSTAPAVSVYYDGSIAASQIKVTSATTIDLAAENVVASTVNGVPRNPTPAYIELDDKGITTSDVVIPGMYTSLLNWHNDVNYAFTQVMPNVYKDLDAIDTNMYVAKAGIAGLWPGLRMDGNPVFSFQDPMLDAFGFVGELIQGQGYVTLPDGFEQGLDIEQMTYEMCDGLLKLEPAGSYTPVNADPFVRTTAVIRVAGDLSVPSINGLPAANMLNRPAAQRTFVPKTKEKRSLARLQERAIVTIASTVAASNTIASTVAASNRRAKPVLGRVADRILLSLATRISDNTRKVKPAAARDYGKAISSLSARISAIPAPTTTSASKPTSSRDYGRLLASVNSRLSSIDTAAGVSNVFRKIKSVASRALDRVVQGLSINLWATAHRVKPAVSRTVDRVISSLSTRISQNTRRIKPAVSRSVDRLLARAAAVAGGTFSGDINCRVACVNKGGVNGQGGLSLWGSTKNAAYAMYLAQPGAGNSWSAGLACTALAAMTSYTMRFRVNNSDTFGFCFENDAETLFGVTGLSRDCWIKGKTTHGGGTAVGRFLDMQIMPSVYYISTTNGTTTYQAIAGTTFTALGTRLLLLDQCNFQGGMAVSGTAQNVSVNMQIRKTSDNSYVNGGGAIITHTRSYSYCYQICSKLTVVAGTSYYLAAQISENTTGSYIVDITETLLTHFV